MDNSLYIKGKQCLKVKFKLEQELEDLMIDNHKLLFGSKTIFINKTKVKNEFLGNAIPDGFLFDFKDINNPQFYLIEVELAKHDFYRHIFPQITKFISFFNSQENRKVLIDKLAETIGTNSEIEAQFKEILGSKEIYKSITDAVENSQNILLVLDKNKAEIDEAKRAYSEWDRLVNVQFLNLYTQDKEQILSLAPPFEEVEITDVSGIENKERYDENYHLEYGNDEMREIYKIIKEKMLKYDKDLLFNPQKYYISIIKNKNFAYIQIRKTKIHIVITLPYNQGKKLIKNHKTAAFSQAIQDFYHSQCFKLTIEDNKNLNEVISILKASTK